MSRSLGLCFGTFLRLFRSRLSLVLENLALRQQLVVLKRHHPRPKLDLFDKLFWLLIRRCWSGWKLQVPAAVRSLNISPVHTSFKSPWQNGIAERWVGSCRRDLLDHVIAIHVGHLKRLLTEYVRYHHEDRTHLGLGKGTPAGRICSANAGRVISHDRLGGLHHRYDRAA